MTGAVGTVYLVGAGCGSADLITVRGRELLGRCDAVVYDDLIARDLLDAAPPGAERIYMGKRRGAHSASQAEICAQLIRLAREGKTVVRLKGGDPFVFGRGGEEALALHDAGIPCQAVPGVTSAVAIPALAGIPVTHRGVSRSVHIVTAHTADSADGLPPDMDALAGLHGTLVFLMGLHQLPAIARRLMAAGMAGTVPAAVISGGNAPSPCTVRGTLADIAQRAAESSVQPPAVILVGQTAAMDMHTCPPRPLQGVRVGLTGTDSFRQRLRESLTRRGASVFDAGRSVIHELPFCPDRTAPADEKRRWLVFTSSNGVDIFFRQLRARKLDMRALGRCRIAVIGAATAAALEKHGLYADLCPETFTAEALGQALLRAEEPGGQMILLRSARGSRELTRLLAQSHTVRDIPLYDIRPDPGVDEAARPLLPEADYITFSSSSGVELFFAAHGAVPDRARCVCIGEVTARALRQRYDRPFLTAADISAEGVAETIVLDRAGA